MKAKELLIEFYNPTDDEVSVYHLDDTRRPRLTMGHIQRLRKSKDVEAVDHARHKEFLPDMYSAPVEGDGLM